MDKPKNVFQTSTQLQLSTVNFLIAFNLGISIFYPNLGSNNPAFFRGCKNLY